MVKKMVFNKYIKYILLIVCFNQTTLADNSVSEETKVVNFYNKGIELMNTGQYKESITYFDKSIKKIPRLGKVYYAKSRALSHLHKFEDAINVCNEALEFNTKQPLILSQKSACLYMLGKYKESLETSQLAVLHGPNCQFAYETRANANAALGNLVQSIQDYDKVLELAKKPDDLRYSMLYLNRFCPLYKLKRYDEALATCNKALEITDNPSNLPQIYSKKSLVLNTLGQHKEALENAEKALKIDAKDPLGISEKNTAETKLKKVGF